MSAGQVLYRNDDIQLLGSAASFSLDFNLTSNYVLTTRGVAWRGVARMRHYAAS